MLCQNERGVLSGSEYFLPTVSDNARLLYYYTTICGHYFCEPGYCIDRTDTQAYLLMSIVQGQLAIETPSGRVVAQAGDTVLLRGYAPHRYYALSYLEFSWVHVSGANSQALCDSLTNGTGVLLTQQQYEEIKALLYQLISRFRNQQRVSEPMCARTIYDVLCCLMPDAGLLTLLEETSAPIDRAVLYIQSRLGEQLSLGEIAAHVQLSPYHFTRIFKKATGYSPYEYLILLRINQAKYLLKNSQLSIKEIGVKVGYNTEISFINAFSQKVGIPPGRFRKIQIG